MTVFALALAVTAALTVARRLPQIVRDGLARSRREAQEIREREQAAAAVAALAGLGWRDVRRLLAGRRVAVTPEQADALAQLREQDGGGR